MLKSILNLNGVQKLPKDQQQKIHGGMGNLICYTQSRCGRTGGILNGGSCVCF